LFEDNNGRFFSDKFNAEVKEIIRESRGLKLPNFFDPSSFHSIIIKEIKTVDKFAKELLMDIKDYIQEILLALSHKAFSNYPTLDRAILGELKNSINVQTDEAWKLTLELLECEKEGEWTVNNYYIDVVNKINFKIKEKKDASNTGSKPATTNSMTPSFKMPFTTPTPVPGATTADQKIIIDDISILENELFTPSVLNAQSNDDLNAVNIQISCFAYWKVFEKRFVDYFQMIILRKMVYFYQKNLGLMLEKKFAPNISKDSYINEDTEITKRRHDLETSIKNLEMAKEQLNTIL
jgi:hypothetical protein